MSLSPTYFKYLQGLWFKHFSGRPVPMITRLSVKNVFLIYNLNVPLLNLSQLHLVLSLHTRRNRETSPGHNSFSGGGREQLVSPCARFPPGWAPQFPQLLPMELVLQTLLQLHSLLWTKFSTSMSFLWSLAQNWTQDLKCDLTKHHNPLFLLFKPNILWF